MQDIVAEEMGIKASLTESWHTRFIKTDFKKDKANRFVAFSATESQKIIVDGILSKEMDFEELIENEVIFDHFPLHKRQLIAKIQKRFDSNYQKLEFGFLTGNWEKYMKPINMIMFYYGEDFAFEYAYLIHYKAWLRIPALFGTFIFIIQFVKMIHTGSLK